MSGLKCADNGDIIFEQNKMSIVTGIEEVMQNLRQRLRTFAGEWFLNISIGVPYYEDIFKKNPDAITVEAAFTNEILNTTGVRELLKINLTFDSAQRELRIDFRALVLDQIIDFSEVITV